MPTDDTSPKKVRQVVVRRLRGMLNGLERARRQPNRREAYYMSQAMECLRADRLPESEQAVTSAVQLSPLPPDFAKKTESNQSLNLVQLRQVLDQLEID